MTKVKFEKIAEFESPIDGVAGTAKLIIVEELPPHLKMPSNAWLAKRWRKDRAYEKIWETSCKAIDEDERATARNILKKNLADPIDFILHLLEYYRTPPSKSKIGGEAKNANDAPMRKQARRVFQEKKAEREKEGKRYSQKQFATAHHEVLKFSYLVRIEEISQVEKEIRKITEAIKLGELDASQLKRERAKKRELEESIRLKPSLPSIKVIEGWLKGL